MRRLETVGFCRRHPVFAWIVVCLSAAGSIQTVSACSLPVQGAWLRADDLRNITFTQSRLLGHRLVTAATGDVHTSFDCLSAQRDRYIFGLPSAVDGVGGEVKAYFCWRLVKSTEITWLLYRLTPETAVGTFSNYRAFEAMANDSAPSLADVCSLKPEDVIPTLLYKTDSTSNTDIDLKTVPEAEDQCPQQITATYSYAVEGSAPCPAAQLDFCLDKRTARVNHTTCAVKAFFSEGGILSCTASFPHGGDRYVILVNHDSAVDNSQYFRFVCLRVPSVLRTSHRRHSSEAESAKSTMVTVYPGDCNVTSGTHQLALNRTKTCAKPAKDTSDDNPMVLIIAVVVAVDAVALVAVFICLYFRAKASKKKRLTRYREGTGIEIEETELQNLRRPRSVWSSTHLPRITVPDANASDQDGDIPPASDESGTAVDGVPVSNGAPRMSTSLSSVADSEPEAENAQSLNETDHVTHM